jgi:hypothetical protein
MHLSGIESGKIVPRCDTLLDLVRVLDHDLLMVPRALVPAVRALMRDRLNQRGTTRVELAVVPILRPCCGPKPDKREPTCLCAGSSFPY